MREGRLERRLAEAMRAASDALRAAAHALEEYSDERGRFDEDDHDRHGHDERGRRDPKADRYPDDERDRGRDEPDDRDGPDDRDEPQRASAHPPPPPYPPFPPYPAFPPYPPIVIACGCGCGHGSSYNHPGLDYGVNAGWPLPPFGAMGAAAPGQGPALGYPAQGGAVSSTYVPPAPLFQPPSAEGLPAGGISFAVQGSAPRPPPDADSESGPTS